MCSVNIIIETELQVKKTLSYRRPTRKALLHQNLMTLLQWQLRVLFHESLTSINQYNNMLSTFIFLLTCIIKHGPNKRRTVQFPLMKLRDRPGTLSIRTVKAFTMFSSFVVHKNNKRKMGQCVNFMACDKEQQSFRFLWHVSCSSSVFVILFSREECIIDTNQNIACITVGLGQFYDRQRLHIAAIPSEYVMKGYSAILPLQIDSISFHTREGWKIMNNIVEKI